MIPFVRSLTELRMMTKSRDLIINNIIEKDMKNISEEIDKSSIDRNFKTKNNIDLPDLPNIKRRKWVKSKEVVSRFFDELDYNNQIQSSYDITLLESQNNYHQHDVA